MRGSPSCSGVQAKRSLGIGGKPWSAPLGRPGWPEEAFEVAATGLQVHTTDSDDSLPLRGMACIARDLGRSSVAITDHSQSLRIANGMDEDRLVLQGHGIDRLNAELAGQGDRFRVPRSIEMDVFADGSNDMNAAALDRLDLVLGAFHTRLRGRRIRPSATWPH